MIFFEVLGNVDLGLTPQINELSRLIKGLGIIAIAWIIYSASIFYMNRKNAKTIKEMKKDLDEANKKLDKLIKRK